MAQVSQDKYLFRPSSLAELSLVVTRQPQESKILGGEVYSFEQLIDVSKKFPSRFTALQQLPEKPAGSRLISARIPWGQIEIVDKLESIGFRQVELTMHPTIDLESLALSSEASNSQILIQRIDGTDVEGVAGKAFQLFKHTRWHRDINLGPELANKRILEWVLDSAGHPNKFLLEAVDLSSATPIGFFLIRRDQDRRSFWELTALYREFWGQGLSRKMWKAFLAFEAESRTSFITTNFNAANLPLYSLYETLGFRLSEPSIALHMFQESGTLVRDEGRLAK